MRDQLISVTIADRPYRLTVGSEKEEEVFRKAAGMVEEKMGEYARNYAFRDKQDLLAMVNLQFAVEYLRLQYTAREEEVIREKLKVVDNLLDECLLEKS